MGPATDQPPKAPSTRERAESRFQALRDVVASVRADLSTYSPPAAARRALRMARAFALRDAPRQLSHNPAYCHHVAAVAPGDRLFWLSHRAYLARGLTPRQRADLALAHYGELAGPGAACLGRLQSSDGLALWRREVEGTSYDIRLMPGHDVLYEGGLSLVLHVDGARVCVLSFSWGPERILMGRGGDALMPFVTRKQLTGERAYQARFHRAFDRVTPAHLCLGALTGICAALGQRRMVGLAADLHPSLTPDRREHFEAAYDTFWASLGGTREAALGWVVDLPPRQKPLDELDAGKRRRAMARRVQVDEVRRSAEAAMRSCWSR